MVQTPSTHPRALLLEGIHADASALLQEAGWLVETADRALPDHEIAGRLEGVELLGIRSQTRVTEALLDKGSSLIAVGAFCIGTNQIDLPAASRRGIAVFNAPFSNTRSVVELVVAEIIGLTRRLTEKDRAMHAGVWDKSAAGAHEVRGRRLGIVGYGNIGTQLSVLAENLGMTVLFYDTADRLALGNARRCGTLGELLASVDIVSLHVDGRPDNRNLFGEEEFAAMRPGSLFLNLSRGFVVDHASLRRHIESGHLAGSAVDVFPSEPSGKGEPFAAAASPAPPDGRCGGPSPQVPIVCDQTRTRQPGQMGRESVERPAGRWSGCPGGRVGQRGDDREPRGDGAGAASAWRDTARALRGGRLVRDRGRGHRPPPQGDHRRRPRRQDRRRLLRP